MKVFKYLRYSSDPQEHGSSIERQTEVIDKFIATRPDFEDELPPFIDDGYSASKGEHLRDGKFGRILSDADSGKYRGHGMIVEKMDRFSRMDYEETASYVKRLTKGGVQLYLAASGRLVNPPEKQLGNIIVNVVEAWQAEDYVKNLTANVTRGWKRIMDEVASGRVLTRNVPEWLEVVGRTYNGAKIINAGRIIEVPERVATVQKMFRLAAQGVGSQNITRQLNGECLTRSWVVRTLRSRAVLGEFQPGKRGEIIQNYFPQIISQSEFDAARAQMDAKRKNGAYVGGNRRKSDLAANLFSGLVFDITSEPARKVHFQECPRGTYIMSAFDGSGRKSNRMRYDKFEPPILDFLTKADWIAIAGETESDEYRAAKAALEATLRQRDIVSRRIEQTNAARENNPNIDTATIIVLATQIAKDGAVLATLDQQIDALQATVDAAQAKTRALSKPEDLLNLLNKSDRLKLKTEIGKRLDRIDLIFLPDKKGFLAIIVLTNGAVRRLIVADILPADSGAHHGITRIEFHFEDEPGVDYESVKEQMLDLARRYSSEPGPSGVDS